MFIIAGLAKKLLAKSPLLLNAETTGLGSNKLRQPGDYCKTERKEWQEQANFHCLAPGIFNSLHNPILGAAKTS